MKPISTNVFSHNGVIVLLAIFLLITAHALAQSGGQYELSWSTIDGGGGTSSGGQYELLGGFWPGEPTCFVDFEHFAKFAEYWLETGIDLPANLYKDSNNVVDNFDLNEFVYEWLWYCPYDWPLR